MGHFGTDGIRERVGEGLITPAGGFEVGLAVGAAAVEGRSSAVVPLGGDTRESGVWLENAIAAGITASGADVLRLGQLPTPAVIYLTNSLSEGVPDWNVDFGVIDTASHNPADYNGIKVVGNRGKLPEDVLANLEGRIQHTLPARHGQPGLEIDGRHLVKEYEDFLVRSAGEGHQRVFGNLKLAIDTANGAASGIAERVFARLGATVVPLFDKPDGRNINENCGATDTSVLEAYVKSEQCDMGIALDGDADRLQMVDEQGRLVNGDHLLYILATADPDKQHTDVVATVLSNMGLEAALADKGVTLHRTDVGDRFVLHKMNEGGYEVGGEQSGHIFTGFLGDGMLAAIRVIKQVRASGRSLASWRDEVPMYPQKSVKFPVNDKELIMGHPKVRELIAEHEENLGDRGRVLLRPSGTEQVVRGMVEARDEQLVEKTLSDITQRLEQHIAEIQDEAA